MSLKSTWYDVHSPVLYNGTCSNRFVHTFILWINVLIFMLCGVSVCVCVWVPINTTMFVCIIRIKQQPRSHSKHKFSIKSDFGRTFCLHCLCMQLVCTKQCVSIYCAIPSLPFVLLGTELWKYCNYTNRFIYLFACARNVPIMNCYDWFECNVWAC